MIIKMPNLLWMALFFVCISISCSKQNSEQSGQGEGGRNSNSPSLNTETPYSSRPLISGKDMQIYKDELLRHIKRESAKLRIKNLIEGSSFDRELRVWVGWGLVLPNCVIIRWNNEERQAFYILRAGPPDKQTANDKTRLPAPLAGWDEFEEFLSNKGVGEQFRLSTDDRITSAPDGREIVIEQRVGGNYGVAAYSIYSNSEDARKAIEVCNKVETEFNISMLCEDNE